MSHGPNPGINQNQWCFAWFAAPPPTTATEKAALQKSSKWGKGASISISFLDGTEEQKSLVRRFATIWITNLANLQFSWEQPPNTDIRITFRYAGSWSVIGTTCKNVLPKTRPTMNFGWLTPGVTDNVARRVILHEFGHALGLIHEHQNPVNAIQWNKPAVYADLSGEPNNWDKATIDHNMFEQYPSNDIAGTTLDWHSIMMYPIAQSWTLGGQSAGLNADLSPTDRSFIKLQYP
jgi:serralysin